MAIFRIKDLVERGPVSRATLYREIAAGRLVARKIRGVTIVFADDYDRWLRAAPVFAAA